MTMSVFSFHFSFLVFSSFYVRFGQKLDRNFMRIVACERIVNHFFSYFGSLILVQHRIKSMSVTYANRSASSTECTQLILSCVEISVCFDFVSTRFSMPFGVNVFDATLVNARKAARWWQQQTYTQPVNVITHRENSIGFSQSTAAERRDVSRVVWFSRHLAVRLQSR